MENAPNNDAAELRTYEGALELLHASDWAKAAEQFRSLVDASDSLHLRDRARQMLAICEEQMADEVEIDDPYLRAVFEKNQGQLDEALSRIGDAAGRDERYAYLAASIESLRGETEHALEHLDNAIRLEPKNRVHAYHDPDFESLREDETFKSLIANA